ncbi:MAG TPA: hypothetical protein VHP36_07325 [Chitinispirillaceae bacterium]|nr:hypothetical protein [Chitinispirillaceae bacterium]
MAILKSTAFPVTIVILFCLYCTPSVAPLASIPKPEIHAVRLDISAKLKEAVHISWSLPQQASSTVKSFTLLRMSGADSLYSVISENIPVDTHNFWDNLEPAAFPVSSSEIDTVYYKIFAIDDLERSGDTSEPCTLYLVQQPVLKSIDLNTGSISWLSNIHFGGLISYCKIWNDSLNKTFVGPEQPVYPPTDKSAVFTYHIPLQSISSGHWYYAFFLRISDAHSIRIGDFNVP